MKKVIIKIFFKIFNILFLLLKIENFNYININIKILCLKDLEIKINF